MYNIIYVWFAAIMNCTWSAKVTSSRISEFWWSIFTRRRQRMLEQRCWGKVKANKKLCCPNGWHMCSCTCNFKIVVIHWDLLIVCEHLGSKAYCCVRLTNLPCPEFMWLPFGCCSVFAGYKRCWRIDVRPYKCASSYMTTKTVILSVLAHLCQGFDTWWPWPFEINELLESNWLPNLNFLSDFILE